MTWSVIGVARPNRSRMHRLSPIEMLIVQGIIGNGKVVAKRNDLVREPGLT